MIVAGLLVAGMAMAQQAEIDRYNVEWDTPRESARVTSPSLFRWAKSLTI